MLSMILVLLLLVICRAIWLILPLVVRIILTVILDITVVTLVIRALLNLRYSDSGVIGKCIKFVLELAILIPFALDILYWANWIFFK